ncbi:unnamed protein product, partial [marine sediment metagenome]
MVSFDTNLGSWKQKAMIALPLVVGGIIGEYIDQKGYDDKLLGSSFIPKLGAPFDKLMPITALALVTFVLFKAGDLTSAKFGITSLAAGAMMGILINYSAKIVLS